MPGQTMPVTATYTITNPALPVDITLRATGVYHGVIIRLRCGATNEPESEIARSGNVFRLTNPTTAKVYLPSNFDLFRFRQSDDAAVSGEIR